MGLDNYQSKVPWQWPWLTFWTDKPATWTNYEFAFKCLGSCWDRRGKASASKNASLCLSLNSPDIFGIVVRGNWVKWFCTFRNDLTSDCRPFREGISFSAWTWYCILHNDWCGDGNSQNVVQKLQYWSSGSENVNTTRCSLCIEMP